MNNAVYQCGLPRSGSTFVWQVMRDVLPDRDVQKVHPKNYTPNGSSVVATYRDPRDVAASLYRVRLSRAGRLIGSMADLDAELTYLRESLELFVEINAGLSLRYEDFWNDHGGVYNGLESMFNIKIGKRARDSLTAAHGLAANTARASKLKTFNDVDGNGVHGDHIATPEPGGWRHVLPEWAHKPMLKVVEPYRVALEYQ